MNVSEIVPSTILKIAVSYIAVSYITSELDGWHYLHPMERFREKAYNC